MNRNLWYYRFKADVNWLDDFIANIEDGFENLIIAMSQTPGVVTGFSVVERALGQNFSVDVSSGWAYDVFGRRVYNAATTNVPFIETYGGDTIECVGVGNERTVSVYGFYNLEESDPVVDGNGDTVYTTNTEATEFRLYQGAEAGAGLSTPATNPNDGSVLLANVVIATGDSTIADADIDNSVADQFTTLIGTVGEAEILFGLGANEVSAEDIPLRDTGTNFTTDDVESALAELAGRADDLESDVAALPDLLLTTGFAIGDLLYASSPTELSNLADIATGNSLISGGVGVAPSWGKIGLTTHVSGTLPIANGGTNITSYTIGDLVYASGTTTLSKLAGVATGNSLISGGVGTAPSWGKIGLTTHVSGTLPVANGGTGTTASTGSGNVVLSASPTFSGTAVFAALTASGNITTTLDVVIAGAGVGHLRLDGSGSGDTYIYSPSSDRIDVVAGAVTMMSFIESTSDTINIPSGVNLDLDDELILPNVDPPTAQQANSNSIVKGWCHYYQPTPVIMNSYNVSSVTDNGTGDFEVNWNVNWATDGDDAAPVASCLVGRIDVGSSSGTPGSTTCETWNSTPIHADTRSYIIACGDQ